MTLQKKKIFQKSDAEVEVFEEKFSLSGFRVSRLGFIGLGFIGLWVSGNTPEKPCPPIQTRKHKVTQTITVLSYK